MFKRHPYRFAAVLAVLCNVVQAPFATGQSAGLPDDVKAKRWATEHMLESLAVIDRKVMISMRDGIRIPADIYYPKDSSKKYPTIWSRTPYNFNFWDVADAVPADMTAAVTALKHGYAYVVMQERGQHFAEGNYDILGTPLTDGEDEIRWMTRQPWSNGKVGTTGCSSSAEWQGAVAALGVPGYAAMNVQGFGAGVGRVGPYYEQGNWYRGGAFQMLFAEWLFDQQNQARPLMPHDATQNDLIQAAKLFDLTPPTPPVDWTKAYWHLPVKDLIKAVDGPRGIFADSMPVSTGGAMIMRTPNDPAWYRGGLFHDDMRIDIPGLWFTSWYDVSIGPNLAMYNHVRSTAKGAAADQQWVIIAPTGHCAYMRASEHTIVGERDVGDARLNYADIMYAFFDRFLKGTNDGVLDTMPKVQYYTMGLDKWQSSNVWPPVGATPRTFYLSSRGHANTRDGDGTLITTVPKTNLVDTFTYDPEHPVMSYGGNVCCQSGVESGARDQREAESRPDVLVFTTEPFKEGMELTGTIVPTLYVSSDAKDTDFSIKVLDVYPDGRAYNLDESIQRMRYRNGYDKPLVWMKPGEVVPVTFQPLTTSNYFAPGHKLRIEISSSNFPRFDRNLNTGGNNYDETQGVVAHNAVHHSRKYPSRIVITVIPKKSQKK